MADAPQDRLLQKTESPSLRERVNGLAGGLSNSQMAGIAIILTVAAMIAAVVYGFLFFRSLGS